LDEETPKYVGLAQEIGFGSASIYSPSFSFMGGVAKEYKTKLGCEKYVRRVIY
jgi:hypothetical protein